MLSAVYLSLLEVSLLILSATLARSFTIKYNLPQVMGELAIGMILSPYLIGGMINSFIGIKLFTINNDLLLFSEFAVVLLIFSTGLESGLSALRSSGVYGALGALFGAILPFIIGGLILSYYVKTSVAFLMGAALGATSLAIASSLIRESSIKGKSVDFMISAGAFDDVISLIILSIVIEMSGTQAIYIGHLIERVAYYVISWLVIFVVSVIIIPRIFNRVNEKYSFELSLVFIFGLTVIMTALGFSPIIAAYIAGVAMAESNKVDVLRKYTDGLLELFGSIFFVTIGVETNLATLSSFGLYLTGLLTGIAILFKMIGVYPFAYLFTKRFRSSLSISLGMIPRGELGLIIASVGFSYGILSTVEFSSIVLMSLLTSIVGAMLFKKYYHYLI